MHMLQSIFFKNKLHARLAATLAACLSLGTPVQAQRIALIAGAGTTGCGDYLAFRKRDSRAIDSTFQSFLNGYISGYNQFSPNAQIAHIPSPATLLAFVDKYCRDNPLSPVKYAADALILMLDGDIITPNQVK
jgi:hypothetical protein